MRTLFSYVMVFCLAASGLNAQTVDETLARLKDAFDWQGESSSNNQGFTSITLVPDGCLFTFDATGQIEGTSLNGRMVVPFKDIDPSSIKFSERSSGTSFKFITKYSHLKTISTVFSASGDGPFLEELRKDPENNTCTAAECRREMNTSYAPSSSYGQISQDQQHVVIDAIKTLEQLCQGESG